jgi:UDP-glucose 4-epimerase
MNILVTGASGQLGSYLVELLSKKHDVVGLDIQKPAFKVKKWEFVLGDIGDYRLAMELCKAKDAVVHAAAQVSVERSVSDPVLDARENVLGTLNMLEASTKTMAGQFVYVSSAAIFGDPVKVPIGEDHPKCPKSPYGVSKLAGENYCFAFQETYGLKVTAIRPFNIYSPRQDPDSPYSGVISRFIQKTMEKKPIIIHGDGSQTRDFVSAHDVVQLVEKCLANKKAFGQAFNCGTGKGVNINDLAKAIIRLSGKKIEVTHSGARPGDIVHSYADISMAKKLLGYKPEITLEKGLAELFG